MRILLTILAVLVVLAGLALAGVYSGAYDVAADVPHGAVARWFLSTTQDRSVEHAAAGIEAPALDDPAQIALGAAHFHEMCEGCHGAPGIERSEIGQGLNPRAPSLSRSAREWSPGELFWMVKHGIKMTGMPAFGPTHDDPAIWSIVAFVHQLPDMSPAEYQAQTAAAGRMPDEHEHHHDADGDGDGEGDAGHSHEEHDHGDTHAGG